MYWRRYIFSLLAVAGTFIMAQTAGATDWKMGGFDIAHTHYNPNETILNTSNVGTLVESWEYDTDGLVSSTPAVVDDEVFITDRGVSLHKLDRAGNVIWKKNIPTLVGSCPGMSGENIPDNLSSRTSPLVMGDNVIFGTSRVSGQMVADLANGIVRSSAYLVNVNRYTGACKWAKKLDNHPAAIITQSPVGFGNNGVPTVIVGTSSWEEGVSSTIANSDFTTLPPFIFVYATCCTFRGSVYAIDVRNGDVRWKFNTIADSQYFADGDPSTPDEAYSPLGAPLYDSNTGQPLQGFSGVAVWGLTHPVIDQKNNSVYLGTGNIYTLSQAKALEATEKMANGDPLDDLYEATGPDYILTDAVAALDLNTGAVKWARNMEDYDPWIVDCLIATLIDIPGLPNNCTAPGGPDSDFGSQPSLVRNVENVIVNGVADPNKRDLLLIGQKSGVFYALDPATGSTIWQTGFFNPFDPQSYQVIDTDGDGIPDTAIPEYSYSPQGLPPVCTGGTSGGFEFGNASDGNLVYASCVNSFGIPWPLGIPGAHQPWAGTYVNGLANNNFADQTYGSHWLAMDVRSGQVVWQTVEPMDLLPGQTPDVPGIDLEGVTLPNAMNLGGVALANGVLYAGSLATFPNQAGNPNMHALDAQTGQILWNFDSGGSVGAIPAVVDGQVFWGTGYPPDGAFMPRIQAKKLFSFTLPPATP